MKKFLLGSFFFAYSMGMLAPVLGQIGGGSIGGGSISAVSPAQAQTNIDRTFQASWTVGTAVGHEFYCLYSDPQPNMASRYATRASMNKVCTTDLSTTINMLLNVPVGSTQYFAVTAVNSSGETVFSPEAFGLVLQVPSGTPGTITIIVIP